jgi:adenylosuccinate lyase
MRANLEASHGLVFSQRLLTALVDAGLARDDAYRLVQGHALRAWESERHLRGLVEADPEIAGRVDLDRVFDPNAFTRHVDTIFERLHALDRRQEAVHA